MVKPNLAFRKNNFWVRPNLALPKIVLELDFSISFLVYTLTPPEL